MFMNKTLRNSNLKDCSGNRNKNLGIHIKSSLNWIECINELCNCNTLFCIVLPEKHY